MLLGNVLITGGTGSFGQAFVRFLNEKKEEVQFKKLIIYSRDEYKQLKMQEWLTFPGKEARFFVGDVRDKERLNTAMKGVNTVIHASALKQVPACEYNPFEAVKTNVLGAWNVIECAIANGVERVVALSTDKAVNPINCYGATKLVAEKLFVNANVFGRKGWQEDSGRTRFSVVRYGNVLASRGSLVESLLKKKAEGREVEVTDERMSRFWWTLRDASEFVLTVLRDMVGGEIFVPELKHALVTDLINRIYPEAEVKFTGIRPGEKLYEALIAPDEERRTIHVEGQYYCVLPESPFFTYAGFSKEKHFVREGLNYTTANLDFRASSSYINSKLEEVLNGKA